MSDQGNIFITYENLAFSMPLIVVVSTYLYFKFVPTHIALSLIAGSVVLYLIQKKVQALKDKKLTNLDEGSIRDLVGEDEADTKHASKTKKQQIKKQKKQVQARLAKEQVNGVNDSIDDDEDDDNLVAFAKKTKTANTKKKR